MKNKTYGFIIKQQHSGFFRFLIVFFLSYMDFQTNNGKVRFLHMSSCLTFNVFTTETSNLR